MCFDNLAAVFTITMGQRYVPLWQIFMRIFYLFDYIFFRNTLNGEAALFYEGGNVLNNRYHGNSKKPVSQLS